MTEKHYIVTHYADGTPSDKRELSNEEYAELTSGGELQNETTDEASNVDEPVVKDEPAVTVVAEPSVTDAG